MSPWIGVGLIMLWMSLVLILCVLARRRWPDQRELSRKILHIGTGPVLPLAWWLGVPAAIALPVAITVTTGAVINHRWHLLPAVEDIDRKSYGTVAYGLAITSLLALFWVDQPQAACAGLLVMAAGDGGAGLLGRALTSPRWSVWGQTKSLAGTATMAGLSLLVLILLSLASPSEPGMAGLLGIALLATGLEQLSRWGLDNLPVPLVVGLSWHWLAR